MQNRQNAFEADRTPDGRNVLPGKSPDQPIVPTAAKDRRWKSFYDRFVDRARIVIHAANKDGIEHNPGAWIDRHYRVDDVLHVLKNPIDFRTDRTVFDKVEVF